MSEYPWNDKNNTFTWLSSLYNPFKKMDMSETLWVHATVIDFLKEKMPPGKILNTL